MAPVARRSPLAPERFPDLPPVAGARFAACPAGIRYPGRLDLALIEVAPGTTAAGVLTRSAVVGHPVSWCRRVLERGGARAVVVNAGNANVLRGAEGDAAVLTEAEAVAAALGCAPDEVLVASTGVIGERLPVERITAAVPELAAALDAGGFAAAAQAIMTTDTFPKGASATAEIAGTPMAIAGIAKGSGMIAPNMATMLAFVVTDAAIPAAALRELLAAAADASFNAITVDSDTSTSDTLLLLATGQAAHAPVRRADDPALAGFRAALDTVLTDLAHQVVRDGEGAEKFIAVAVEGAVDRGSARQIALAIANSPLVKTAVAGGDANWGRVVMAVGKSGEPIELDRLGVAFGGFAVARVGAAVPGLDEAPVAAHLAGREILIEVTVGTGPGRFTAWTCDLTHGYIDINADYRS